MTDDEPGSTPPGVAADPDPARAGTESTAASYSLARVRELETDLEQVAASRDDWETRAAALTAELDRTRASLGSLGRVGRIWLTLRGATRRRSSPLRLPLDLYRAATAPFDPIRIQPAVAPSGVPPVPDSRVAAERAILARSSRPAPRRPLASLRVALIADDRLMAGLAPDCRLAPVRPDDWARAFEAERPDLLLVESAVRGGRGAWEYRVGSYPHPSSIGSRELGAAARWCADHDVPVVFWNTRDPVRSDTWEDAARLADWVFTVAPESAARYEAMTGRRAAGVDVLPAAIQPSLHWPDPSAPADEAGPLLAGIGEPAWRLDRREALVGLAEAAVARRATIWDAAWGTTERPDLPPAVLAAPRAFEPVEGLPARYRRHPAVVVASASPGVVPAELVEALACGRPVLSAAVPVARAAFGDLVTDLDPADAAAIGAALDRLLDDPGARVRAERDGLRLAVRHGTYRDRLATIARTVGLDVDPGRPRIAALALVDAEGDSDALVRALAAQDRPPDEVVIGSTSWDGVGRPVEERLRRALPGTPVVLVEQRAGATPSERHRHLAGAAQADLLAIVPDRLGDAAGPAGDGQADVDAGWIERLAAAAERGPEGAQPGLVARSALLDGRSVLAVGGP